MTRRRNLIVFLAAAIAVVLPACGNGGGNESAPTTSVTTTAPTTTAPTTAAPTTAAPTTAAPTTVAPTTTSPPAFAYQPLWPFHSLVDAQQWQAAYRDGGHQPWHLDADATALAFANGFLGYTEIDRVTSRAGTATDTHVGVGYADDELATHIGTAAVVHLVRLGSGQDAPWEVVGTDDGPDFTLTVPAYGATVSSPVTVGGRITGVDESIRVDVRSPSATAPVGSSCCLPAGGENTSWRVSVPFSGATDPVLTITASTGGHLKAVERFAVTGAENGTLAAR